MKASLIQIEVDRNERGGLTLKDLFEVICSPHMPSHGVFEVIHANESKESGQGNSDAALEVKEDAHSR